MRFVSNELGPEVFFFVRVRRQRRRSSMRDAPSERTVARSALLRFRFLIVNIAGGQREGLPVGVTGQRKGLKHHRSGECADERLAGG